MVHAGHAGADAVDRLEIIAVGAHDAGAAVLEEVSEVVGREAIVEWHEHRADLRHRVERFELCLSVGRDVGDAIALTHTQRLQRGRPAIHAIEEARVRRPALAIDDRFPIAIKAPGAARELERRQGRLHRFGRRCRAN